MLSVPVRPVGSELRSELRLYPVDPTCDPAWSRLAQDGDSTLFHTARWMRVLRDTYGLTFRALLLADGERPVAGVPWSDVHDFLGSRRITLAFSDYCDLLAERPEYRQALAAALAADGTPWVLRTLARNAPQVSVPAAHSTLFKRQWIDAREEPQALWERLTPMAQRGVRKAERSGVTVRPASSKDELRRWFLLHLRLRQSKHHLLAQPYAFFERLWDTFVEPGQGFLLLALSNDCIIGGTLYLIWKDVCYYKFNASDFDGLALRPNNVLLWRGLLEAQSRGCRSLDLGRCNAKQEGLLNFKRGFGAQEEDMQALTYRNGHGQSPQEQEAQLLLQSLTRIFVQEQVPADVTEQAGNLLYRFFT